MKKILLCATLATAVTANAQVFSEDFSNGMPANFTIIDVDGLTPDANVNFVTDGWVTQTSNDGNQYAVSTSWYAPAGTSDDWMVTPGIAVTTDNYLLWKAGAQDQSFPDGYEVYIGTTGTTAADFATLTPVFTTAGEGVVFTPRSYDLSSYAGQTIYVAFHNNSNDQFLLLVDDILVDAFTTLDMAGTSTPVAPFAGINSPVDVAATFTNNGKVITTADFNYSVNGGTTVTEALTGINVGPTGTLDLVHGTAWTPTAAGSYTIEMWLSNLNGNPDDDLTNDKVSVTVEAAASVARTVLAEEFSSSTCPPCFTWNTNVYNTALASYNKPGSDKLVVKYQIPIPVAGDPSHNGDGDARLNYYGVNSAPSMLINGSIIDYNITTWAEGVAQYTQEETDGLASPAFVTVSATADFTTTATTGDVSVTVDVTPNIDMSAGYALQIAVMQQNYIYNGASNGDFNYHHVMRKMLPSANGTAITAAAGATQSITETYSFNVVSGPAEGSFDLWNHGIEIIAYVENTNNRIIMNAGMANINLIGLDENVAKSFDMYPNPVKDILNIELKDVNADASVELVNAIGQIVFNGVYSAEKIQISTSDLDRGLYIINVTQNGETTSSKLSIVD